MAASPGEEDSLQTLDLGRQVAEPGAEVQASVGRHLVVSASGGVKLAGDFSDDLAEPNLDGRMDVLDIAGKLRRTLGEDLFEALDEATRFFGIEDSCFAEHPGVGDAARDILVPKAKVGLDALPESIDEGIRIRVEGPAPEFAHERF
jgi:hypothetical protein